jgi:hypothetical protein
MIRTISLVTVACLLIFGCNSSESSVGQKSKLSMTFAEQNRCGVKSVATGISAYLLNDDNSINKAFDLSSAGQASVRVGAGTASFMVIRELDNGLDVYVAKDIDTGDLGTWYFDTEDTTGCTCRSDGNSKVSVKVSPGNLADNHLNWPHGNPASDNATTTYEDIDYCISTSSEYLEPLLVAFANDTSAELRYYVDSNPSELVTNNIIDVDLASIVTVGNALTINQSEVGQGSLYYASDDIYEFHADYDSLQGANLLVDDRVKPLRFSTTKQLTSGSASSDIKWSVNLPLTKNTSSINYEVPSADTNALKTFVESNQTSFDFSSDAKLNATLEYFSISDSGKQDQWTIIQGVSGDRFTQFALPDSIVRSSTYGASPTGYSMSLIDLVNYDGYLYSDQGKALRELFAQSGADGMAQLHPKAWSLDFEIHEVSATQF